MLVLSRKKNESIVINNDITIVVVEIRGDKVRLGVEAPKEVPVHRREVYDAIRRNELAEGDKLPTADAAGRGDVNGTPAPRPQSCPQSSRLSRHRIRAVFQRNVAALVPALATLAALDGYGCRTIIHRGLHAWRSPDSASCRLRPRRLAWSRTPAFHADNTGSNPVGVTSSRWMRRSVHCRRDRSADDDELAYDAVLIVSFGGPEGPDDVLPFLENVLRGKHVPRERMLAVAEHYQHFGGVSPLNAQNRALIAALERELAAHGPHCRSTGATATGIRCWPTRWPKWPRDGVRRARLFHLGLQLLLRLPAISRKHRRRPAASRPAAPQSTNSGRSSTIRASSQPRSMRVADGAGTDSARERAGTRRRLVFTAHSIPLSMADDCRYVAQLERNGAAGGRRQSDRQRMAAGLSKPQRPPRPALARARHLRLSARASPPRAVRDVVVAPIGFLSDHLEVLYDLDTEAQRALRAELGSEHGPRGHGGHIIPNSSHDPRADRRAHRRTAASAGPGHLRPEPRRLPGGLLPARTRAKQAVAPRRFASRSDVDDLTLRSTIIATALPPPRQRVARPRCRPRRPERAAA